MRRHAVLLCSAALLLAGCSGGDDAVEGGSAPPADPSGGQAAGQDTAGELLEAEGYLGDDGSVQFGPAGPSGDETEVQAALCTYLFGTPEEVADRATLPGAVLAEGSGYEMLGSNGSGIRCGWGEDDQSPVLVLWSWGDRSEWIEEGADDLALVVDLPGGGVGVAAYDPEAEVQPLSESELQEWLEQAPAVSQSV